jgi:hypothetical protein
MEVAANTQVNTPIDAQVNITTIKTTNGELYVQGDKIIGRMETNGNITRYYRGDKLHRDGDLPAYIRRNDAQCFAKQSINGAVTCEEYYRDGKRHRDGDLPAYIKRNNAGVIIGEIYYRDGKKHRDGTVSRGGTVSDLPAYIERNYAGEVIYKYYYRDGVEISPKEIKYAKIKTEAAQYQEEAAAAKAEAAALRAELDELKRKIAALAV